MELLLIIPRIGIISEFLDISVDESLVPDFPARFLDTEDMETCTRALAPPPKASADEIVTPMGGTFYAREAPHLPVLVEVGDHFDAGEPLFIIEVMKMFNKVVAPFAGYCHQEPAWLIRMPRSWRRVSAIFKIEPDERIVEEAPETVARLG